VKPSAETGFILLLAATLGLKVLISSPAPAPDAAAFRAAASGMLREAGLRTSVERLHFGELLWGTRGACRVMVAEDDPHGTFAELYRRFAQPVGPLRSAWRGRAYGAAPRKVALVRFYVHREVARLGLAGAREPLVAWAASTECEGLRLDWRRLSVLAR
jgi:hypothetical protein